MVILLASAIGRRGFDGQIVSVSPCFARYLAVISARASAPQRVDVAVLLAKFRLLSGMCR
jgi:hypothetical protein